MKTHSRTLLSHAAMLLSGASLLSGCGVDAAMADGEAEMVGEAAQALQPDTGHPVWAIDASDHHAYMYSGNGQWTQKVGYFKTVAVGGNEVWGITSFGSWLYRWNGSSWDSKFGAVTVKSVAVGADNEVWAINTNGLAYRFDAATSTWQEKSDGVTDLAQISVGSSSRIYAVTYTGTLKRRTRTGWETIGPYPFSNVSVGADGTVCGVMAGPPWQGTVACWDGITKGTPMGPYPAWYVITDYSTSNFTEISVASRDEIWGVNSSYQVLRWIPSTASWEQIPGSNKTWVSVGLPRTQSPQGNLKDFFQAESAFTGALTEEFLKQESTMTPTSFDRVDLSGLAPPDTSHLSYSSAGSGTPPTACLGNKEYFRGKCYNPCQSGYSRDGGGYDTTCYQNCGEGYRPSGWWCAPENFDCPTLHSFFEWCTTCPDGWLSLYAECWKDSDGFWRAAVTASGEENAHCASNEEEYNNLCYPKCAPGYRRAGTECVLDGADEANPDSCLQLYSPLMADYTKFLGSLLGDWVTLSFGISAELDSVLYTSLEKGVVYGARGEFGCYTTMCNGIVSAVGVSVAGTYSVGFTGFEDGGSDTWGLGLSAEFPVVANAGVAVNASFQGLKPVGMGASFSVGPGLSTGAVVSGAACHTDTFQVVYPDEDLPSKVITGLGVSASGPTYGDTDPAFVVGKIKDGDLTTATHASANPPDKFGYTFTLNDTSDVIDRIDIYPRQYNTTSEFGRLSNYIVALLPSNEANITPVNATGAIWSKEMHTDGSNAGGLGKVDKINVPNVSGAKYVRIESLASPVPAYAMQIAEVNIFKLETAQTETNLTDPGRCTVSALGGTIWSPWTPFNLIDGDLTTLVHSSQQQPPPYFGYRFDFSVPAAVQNIEIFPRQDCPELAGRLSNYKVELFDINGLSLWSKEMHTDGSNAGCAGNKDVISVPNKQNVKYVKITSTEQFPHEYGMQIAEVTIR